MTWSLHIRSAFIAFAAVARLAASEAEADVSLQDEALVVEQNPFDNVAFFYPMLDKPKLVELLINDGMILPPPTIPECRHDDGPLDHAPVYASGSTYRCQDWLLVNAQDPNQAVSPCKPVQFHDLTNLDSTHGRIEKYSGEERWDAGATSDPFDVAGSGIRGVSFEPVHNDKKLAVGLTDDAAGETLRYAAKLTASGNLRVNEMGEDRGKFGSYSAGSTVSLVINHANQVEYRVDGEIRYVSALPVPGSLRVRANFKDLGAALENAMWAPVPAAHASIKAVGAGVDFKFQRGLVSNLGTGEVGSLVTGAEALSAHAITGSDHITGFAFKPSQKNKEISFGLTSNLGLDGRGDPQYSVTCDQGSLTMKELGMPTPLGSFEKGDLVEMSLNDAGKVEVKVNGESKYVSGSTPALPIAVEARFADKNAEAYDVKWAGMESCIVPESYGHPVGFDGFKGVTQLDRGHYRKVSGSNWGSGKATSLKHFTEDDAVSGVSFQVASTTKTLMVGLSKTPLHAGHIADYAARCEDGGSLNIYEGPMKVGRFGKLVPHDRVAIIVNSHGSVEFSVNGLVRYTSKGKANYPLNVVASLLDLEGEIYNVRWTNALEENSHAPAPVLADTPTHFDMVHGVEKEDGGILRKLASFGDGWNAGAVSVDGLPRLNHVGGVSFKPRFSDRWTVVGLGGSGTMMGWDNADFAAHCKADGTLVIVEKGSYIGEYGHYAGGDKVELVVNEQDHVEYRVNGGIRYVSKSKASFPLSVKTFFHHAQAEAAIQWSGCIDHLPYEGLLEMSDPVDFCERDAAHSAQDDLVRFTLFDGLVSPDGLKKGALEKMDDISPGHYGTAVSFDEITESSDITGISFQPLQENALVTIGMTHSSHLDQRIHDSDLDFAVVLNGGGEMEMQVSGQPRTPLGPYKAYDAIEIRRADNAFQVFQNGQNVGGGGSLAFPLRAVAMISDPEAVIYNIRWTGPGVHAFALADRAPIEFASSGMNSVSLLEKQRMRSVPGARQINGQQGLGSGVQSRAMSVDAITADNEVNGIQFQLPGSSFETVLVGLHPDIETQDLAFALRSQGGQLLVVQNGAVVGGLGPFTGSDTLSIVLTPSSVEYRLGCRMVVPRPLDSSVLASPLHAHVFLSETTEISNFVWLSQNPCPNSMTVDAPMVFDKFSGLGQVGAGSVRKFTSSAMDWDSNVVSTNSITAPDDASAQGFVFQAPSLDAQALVGFTHSDSGTLSVTDLDHALFFGSDGGVSVWEKGSFIGDFGTYEAGQLVRIAVNQMGEMEYIVNDQVRYTSIQGPSFPIKMSAFILNPGGRVDGLAWHQASSAPSAGTTPGSPVEFHRFRGGAVAPSAAGGALHKLPTSAAAWNGGAISAGMALPTGYTKGVSFRPKPLDEHHLAQLMVGLSTSGGPSVNYKAMDFGALLLRTGEFQVLEKGEFKGTFGSYKADEEIKIIRNGATVEYWVGDEETARFVSEETVHAPLFVDVALYDPDAEVYDVKWA